MIFFLFLNIILFSQNDNKAENWMKHSPEYKAICSQTYYNAKVKLDSALNDKLWTAELSQLEDELVWDNKPAIILDIDETVLDNIGFFDLLQELDTVYTPELWDKWVKKAEATAIVGAVEFIKYAESKGVEIFYITNRECTQRDSVKCPQQEETINNLNKIGLKTDDYHLLLKKEYRDWSSNKGIRRKILTEQYRIILIIGDDFNDFYDNAVNLNQQEKFDALYKNINYFGEKWFLLPNPSYGSWQNY